MIIHIGDEELEVMEDDASTLYRSLMAKPVLTLKFSLPYWLDIPVNSWVEFWNEKYYLTDEPTIKKQNTRNIEYTLTMSTDMCKLELYKLHNTVDYRLKWSMCAKPHEFIEKIVKNLNERVGEDVWKVGECIEANEKTIEFNHSNLLSALQSVADEFETEWEIVDNTISLKKVEYFSEDPVSLSYGKGNGFVAGLGRTVVSGERPIKRLYVQGGETNIDRSKYGSSTLLLPKSQSLNYDGRTYTSDVNGYYIERTDKESDAEMEDSLECDEIYPKRVGEVSEVIVENEEKNFYDFTDASIPESLNYNDCLIAGEKAYIRFQTGMLAGEKDFEFQYTHSERKFLLVPQEIDGVTMPNKTFCPKVGDTYAVFGISLPQSYIADDETQTGAEWEMFKEAAKHLRENEDQKFTFTGELQSIWAKNNWGRIGGMLKVGSYVNFVDNQFAKDGVKIRITGIRYNLTNPHAPKLELSNETSSSSIASALREIKNTEVVIEDAKKEVIRYTNRRWRDARETMTALEDALLNFSDGINPVTVQTMGMLVGDESLQFRFVKSKDELEPITYNITYNAENKELHCHSGFLQHMTLGINSISSTHADSEYKVWELSEYLSPVLDDEKAKYYLYAKVDANDTSVKGEFLLSETAIEMNEVSGYYHLLVGILNSEHENDRSFVTLYGYTEILPSQIRTDIIISADGKTYFDLSNGEIGGKIRFLGDNGEYVTIIEGGKIKTELIDVNGITAGRVLVGDENGRHVLIAPDEATAEGRMTVYDEEANESVIIEGNKYTSISELFGNEQSGSVPIPLRSEACYGYDEGISMGTGVIRTALTETALNENVILSDLFYTYVPTEIKFDTGNINVNLSAFGVETKAFVVLFVETYSDEEATELTSKVQMMQYMHILAGSVGSNTYNGDITITDKSVRVGRGYHRLVMGVTITKGINGWANVSWGGFEDGRDAITASYNTKFFVTRYFANGLALGDKIDNYFALIHNEKNDRVSANYACEDFKTLMSNSGVSMSWNGSNLMQQPILVYNCLYYYNSSSKTYSADLAGYSINGSLMDCQRTDTGKVTLKIPSSWSSIFNGVFNRSHIIPMTNAYADSVSADNIDARVEGLNSSEIYVTMSDDSSGNDCDFLISLYFMPPVMG